jgi:nitrite reductase (NADH) large subunit
VSILLTLVKKCITLLKLGNIRSFDDFVAKHGKGDGCDICKPTAASIFASLWNEHILKKPLAGLQDTNDYFLANMQKDGTYSIVPSVYLAVKLHLKV